MNLYIPAFAIAHAREARRDHLLSTDVLAAIYLYSSDCLSSLGDIRKIASFVREICDFREPLWIIQSRYFANLHSGEEGLGPLVTVPEHLKDFLDLRNTSDIKEEDYAEYLLGKLLQADQELKSLLASHG